MREETECTHHYIIESPDKTKSKHLLGFCKHCGKQRLFNRKAKFKAPSQKEYILMRKIIEEEEWLDKIAPRYPDAEDVLLERRRQAHDWNLRRRPATEKK